MAALTVCATRAVASSKKHWSKQSAQPRKLDTPGKRLAADYYASGMDLPSIEKRGLTSLAPLLSQIDALNDRAQLPALLAQNGTVSDSRAIFSFRCGPTRRTSVATSWCSIKSGLGLPDRDDYFRRRCANARVAQCVRGLPASICPIIRWRRGLRRSAGAVFALETDLARASLTRVERRDPNVVYNLHTVGSLTKLGSRIRLGCVLRRAGNRRALRSST